MGRSHIEMSLARYVCNEAICQLIQCSAQCQNIVIVLEGHVRQFILETLGGCLKGEVKEQE